MEKHDWINFKSLHSDCEINNNDFNNYFEEIKNNLIEINKNILDGSEKLKGIMESSKLKIDNIKKVLNTEKERQEDINMLCNRFTDFSDVIIITDANSDGNLEFANDIFNLERHSDKKVKLEIVEIVGNGYEGNSYVYSNDDFISKINDTSNRDAITDSNVISYYEYSRLTANNSEEEVFPLINFDSIYAKCSLTLKSSETFNSLKISSDDDSIILDSLFTSNDGQNFKRHSLSNIKINNRESRYNKENYIFGSGVLAFEDCKYIKLVMRASSYTKDNIAFEKKKNGKKETIKLKSGKRSAIKINDISAGRTTYKTTGKRIVSKFISEPINSIAIFANEYGADNIDIRKSIKYTLTINGTDYNIIPINSNYNDKKVIRTTNNAIPTEYVHYINETIKEASLNIDLSSSSEEYTPYISNLKILIGGEED